MRFDQLAITGVRPMGVRVVPRGSAEAERGRPAPGDIFHARVRANRPKE